MNATTEPPTVGFLDEDRVVYAEGQKLGPLVKVTRSRDKFTGSGTFG